MINAVIMQQTRIILNNRISVETLNP